MSKPANARAAAAQALFQVIEQGRSLSQALPDTTQALSASDAAFTQAMCYQALRFLPTYEWFIRALVDKPLKNKVRIAHYLLVVGIVQLRDMRTPAHAAIGETVNATMLLKQASLKGMVNGVLRSFQRQEETLEQALKSEQAKSAGLRTDHPGWLQRRLEAAYPEQWEQVCTRNNMAPPLWLRVNHSKTSRDQYLALLAEQGIDAVTDTQALDAIRLPTARDVTQLPGFADGHVSVQDRSAQFAAHLLDAQPGERILDACAAPGGKTAHILERTPDAIVHALDFDAARLNRVHENLARLQLEATVICGDAADPSEWWDNACYDRILLDAPCSATGVIRRHPDIKWLRRATDIDALVALQERILHAQWALLKVGGRLVYATCSVLPDENTKQIQKFLTTVKDARVVPIEHASEHDWQLLPEPESGDGFYYCVLEKTADSA
ncbi:16S rRNA (cytosine(967)-C(5))-methyltransferase RsmB [Aliidiomarina halalkaliphila]|uniref:16S rRNA (cytosine(967)-C(5))-methyltransferase n=1 Tax=Aliidiomarina halalkaliphila TaxID=2593535 RepID=A0A552X158_9GAMM|nr:16S rRNA (cytosine(967)-C(5))-methyltransferase RsmB [Aliidiomarina halalkaliphila]TRW48767.1 16S rRNA (cytosine(967)-C(5))-methyltransferase RsmB [Aliidiomarina halalkaliphila]